MRKFLLGATLLFGLAWAVPADPQVSFDDWDPDWSDAPRLVGFGCEGASGPLFAAEEDHFPKCVAIEAYPYVD